MNIFDIEKYSEEKEIRRLQLEKFRREEIEEFKKEQQRADEPMFSWGDLRIYPDGRTSLEKPRSIDPESMPFKIFKALGKSLETPPIIKFSDFKENKGKVKQTVADIRRYYKPNLNIFQSVRGVGYRLKKPI